MKPTRYFAMIYLQTTRSRKAAADSAEALENAQFLVKHFKAKYPEAVAVFTHANAVIFALVDAASASDVFKKLAPGLRAGDQLSVVEVGSDIAATHPGLNSWHSNTRFLTS